MDARVGQKLLNFGIILGIIFGITFEYFSERISNAVGGEKRAKRRQERHEGPSRASKSEKHAFAEKSKTSGAMNNLSFSHRRPQTSLQLLFLGCINVGNHYHLQQ